jgi:hypothetical protein
MHPRLTADALVCASAHQRRRARPNAAPLKRALARSRLLRMLRLTEAIEAAAPEANSLQDSADRRLEPTAGTQRARRAVATAVDKRTFIQGCMLTAQLRV